MGEIEREDGGANMRFISAAFLLAAGLVVFASCDLGESRVPTPEGREPSVIKGQVLFMPHDRTFFGALGDSCEADGVSYDLRGGTPVVVKDAAGSTIATGELEPGEIVDLSFAEHNGCRFPFTVEDVPVSAYYEIEVGDEAAHTSTSVSYDDLEAANWLVEWGVGE